MVSNFALTLVIFLNHIHILIDKIFADLRHKRGEENRREKRSKQITHGPHKNVAKRGFLSF